MWYFFNDATGKQAGRQLEKGFVILFEPAQNFETGTTKTNTLERSLVVPKYF